MALQQRKKRDRRDFRDFVFTGKLREREEMIDGNEDPGLRCSSFYSTNRITTVCILEFRFKIILYL